MPARHRLVAALATLIVFSGVGAVSAVEVLTPAQVDFTAYRVDPPAYVADPTHRARVAVIDLVNQVRSEAGMPPVQLDDRVTLAAQRHADYLASIRQLSHTGSGGSNTGDRLLAAGYEWSAWGENVGAGMREPDQLVDAWYGSDTHRAQLVGGYLYAGVGLGVTPDNVPYWVLVLTT